VLATNGYGDGSVDGAWDALIYGIAAWFMVTKRSRIAAGVALVSYLLGQVVLLADSVTVWGVHARPGYLTVLITAALVQALRATIRAHRLRHVITPSPAALLPVVEY
jgi:hypothetical protein